MEVAKCALYCSSGFCVTVDDALVPAEIIRAMTKSQQLPASRFL
jgi:hypothetical protein